MVFIEDVYEIPEGDNEVKVFVETEDGEYYSNVLSEDSDEIEPGDEIDIEGWDNIGEDEWAENYPSNESDDEDSDEDSYEDED